MKKLILLFAVLGFSTIAFANAGQYEKAMAEGIPAMFQARDISSLTGAVNQLSRVGDAEGNKWEPYYYAAFGYIRMMDLAETAEEKDTFLDQALETIKKGEEIKPNDSELESLRGYVHMMRVTVDPATRGMQYSGLAFTSFSKAVALDGNNARAHYLLGRMQYGTAQFMGNGDGGACESFAKAKEILEGGSKSENPFAPSWGLEEANAVIKQLCKG